MGLAFARTRRSVARGAQAGEAIAENAALFDGAQARVRQWEKMRAARLGMTTELWRLLREAEVTDVVISGTQAWVDQGAGLTPVPVGLYSEEEARRLAVQMAAAAGRRLDDAQPIVDAVLPGPVRLHAVLPPVAQSGTAISLRVLRPRPFALADLLDRSMLSLETATKLQEAVESHRSVLVAGATGAGKTTLLATLLGLVASEQRIVAIEEVSELAVDHPHVISLQARPANIEGEGEVALEELVRAAVRMRPDRLVLGECRGPEVREVLTALNTGHRGGMATIHANSVEDVPARLLALAMLAGMDPGTTALMAASAFDLVVFLRREASGRRRVQSLGELQLTGGALQTRTVWQAQPGQSGPGES